MDSSPPPMKEDHDIRDYVLMEKIGKLFRSLKPEELKGAYATIFILYSHLYKKHFEDKIQINQRALVKSLEEMDEIGQEILYFEHGITGFEKE
jgi:hypothetical protein